MYKFSILLTCLQDVHSRHCYRDLPAVWSYIHVSSVSHSILYDCHPFSIVASADEGITEESTPPWTVQAACEQRTSWTAVFCQITGIRNNHIARSSVSRWGQIPLHLSVLKTSSPTKISTFLSRLQTCRRLFSSRPISKPLYYDATYNVIHIL